MTDAQTFSQRITDTAAIMERAVPTTDMHIGELIDICADDGYSPRLRAKAAAALYARGQADAFAMAKKLTDAVTP